MKNEAGHQALSKTLLVIKILLSVLTPLSIPVSFCLLPSCCHALNKLDLSANEIYGI